MASAIQERLREYDPELLVVEGLDSAIIGVAERCGGPDVVAYDVDQCIASLIVEQGMSVEDAKDWFDTNVIGSHLGPRTPIFIRSITQFH